MAMKKPPDPNRLRELIIMLGGLAAFLMASYAILLMR